MKPNRQNNNFFTKTIQKFGQNFTETMNARDMQNGAPALFRDLAKGKIDVSKYGQYFLDNQFMDICLLEARNKLQLHSVNFNALNWFVNCNRIQDENMLQILEYDRRCMCAYGYIVESLNAIRCTGNVQYLFSLINNLRDYRNNI